MSGCMTPVVSVACLVTHCALAGMMTPWGEKVTTENAWRDYPRPQMVRDNWTCLNGEWDYAITSVTNTSGRPMQWQGKIRVPFATKKAGMKREGFPFGISAKSKRAPGGRFAKRKTRGMDFGIIFRHGKSDVFSEEFI